MAKNFYANTVTTNPAKVVTPQSEPIPGRETEMVKNSAGGFTFSLDDWGLLDRFLILGSDVPSYYASARELTLKASKSVIDAIKSDGLRVVNRTVEISTSGRAPKNDPAVFVLALCVVHGSAETIAAAYAALPKVARIGTHLFQFVAALDELGKWNAAAKRGITAWYTERQVDKLAVQLLKYQQRNGWSHRDVLRLAHVKPKNDMQNILFRYVVKGAEGIIDATHVPKLLESFEALKGADAKKAIALIEQNSDITWEMMPTELQRDVDVMMALLPNMGITAIIRKLGQLSNIGALMPLSAGEKLVMNKLSNPELIKAGRVHPITILNAVKQYGAGHGLRGSLTWSPNKRVCDSLQDAFYSAFSNVETTGKNHLIGIDCSGSMWGARVSGSEFLSAAEVAAVMAMAVVKSEPNSWVGGFNTQMSELKISPKDRLETVLRTMQKFAWGGTDCAQPMLHALQHNMEVDKFVVYTDNETWAGRIQPVQALAQYRAKHVKDAKLIVCATSVTKFTIADPKDPGMLDIVGFDSAAPQLIQQF